MVGGGRYVEISGVSYRSGGTSTPSIGKSLPMRLEKSEQLLALALGMQASAEGLGLQDIQEQFSVGRRTAERMRDAVLRLFPQIEELRQEDGSKRWRLAPGALSQLVHFSADELAQLQSAVELLRHQHLQAQADWLQQLTTKLSGMMRSEVRRRTAADVEALLEAEGYACRVGPRPKIDLDVLVAIRQAIQGCCKLHIHYQSRLHGGISERVIAPYGLLYGSRHYLLAHCDMAGDLRTFSLANIHRATLMWEFYSLPAGFDLKAEVNSRFGVYRETPMQVVWRFGTEVVADAAEHLFHPGQQMEMLADGRLEVRFTAGGWREMCWHLIQWEGHVEIVSPPELRQRYQQWLRMMASGEPIPRFSDPLYRAGHDSQLELEV